MAFFNTHHDGIAVNIGGQDIGTVRNGRIECDHGCLVEGDLLGMKKLEPVSKLKQSRS